MSANIRRVARAASASMSKTADQSGWRTNKAAILVLSAQNITLRLPPSIAKAV